MKTNLQHLISAIDRVRSSNMMVFKNGQENNDGFIVVNENTAYNVDVENNEIVHCTCPHHTHRGVICKHMVKVSLVQNLNVKGLTAIIETSSNITHISAAK